jgi:pyrimidine-nucleoside phosphorylase
MLASDIIRKKRDGAKLSKEEIRHFVHGLMKGDVTDYQASALLMAVFLRGMEFDETAALTREMMVSGETYDLPEAEYGRTVDKHSTGGVGDKVSLVLAPLVAACGVTVPMVSGRGLGHTGGTLDKLESIPGFRVNLSREEFFRQLRDLRVAMIGQSDRFVPADKRLYALRDVTATVESIPLICASILSKKVASGAHALVMDVKVGSGAFMDTLDKARELADGLRGVGEALGRPVRALLTDMSQPLGRMVGNAVEVREAIDCLRGGGPADLREITIELAAEMLALSTGESGDGAIAAARKRAADALDSGRAMERFIEMVGEQGGDVSAVENPDKLARARDVEEFRSDRGGFVSAMDCRQIGMAALELGAGRRKVTDPIDYGVGLEMLAKVGERVEAKQPLVRIMHNGAGIDACRTRLSKALAIGAEAPRQVPLILERK